MRIYAAQSGDEGELTATEYPNVLVSYAFDKERVFLQRAAYRPRHMLDSGAFSVWSQGVTIDVNEYAEWATAYVAESPTQVLITNLDVIPGSLEGRHASQVGSVSAEDRARAVAQGFRNADSLREYGLPVIEVYHRHEPLSVLDAIVERRRPGELIGLGGLVAGTDTQGKLAFCDAVFSRLREIAGGWDALVPVHGYGIGADSRLGQRYPWYSIDSTSWFRGRRFRINYGRSGIRGDDITDGRPVVREQGKVYSHRVLERWKRVEQQLTRMWEGRGVCFIDVPYDPEEDA